MSDKMTDEEAIEALTDKKVVNPYLTLEALDIAVDALRERVERKNAVCGKCACYDRQFSYCDKLGVTFADDDFCSCFEQKEVDE